MMRMFVLSVVVCFVCGIGFSKTWEEMTWKEGLAMLEKMTDEEIMTVYETQEEVYCRNLETNMMSSDAIFYITDLQHSVFKQLCGNPKRPKLTLDEYRIRQRRFTRIGLKILVCIHSCIGKLSKVKIRPENEPWLYKGKPFSAPWEDYMKDPDEIKAWRKLREEVEFSEKVRSAIGRMKGAYDSMHSTLQLCLSTIKEEVTEEYPIYKKIVDELVPDESLKRSLWQPFPFRRVIYVPLEK